MKNVTSVFALAACAALVSVSPQVAHADDDDSLTLHGVTLYGTIDLGASYRNHGEASNAYYPPGVDTIVIGAKNANKPTYNFTPNNMTTSKLGIKGTEALIDNWSAVFKAETGFNPLSGQIVDGLKSEVQQNGVPLGRQNTGWGDSTRAGQIFQGGIYGGIDNPTFGTLTFGRQNSLTWDNCITYDPTYASNLSLIGYSGGPAGAGDTEDRLFDNSVKYTGHYGPLRAGGIYAFGEQGSDAKNAYQVDAGLTYGAFSMDAAFSKIKDAVSTSPLTVNATGALSSAQIAAMTLGGFNETNTLAATVSDNTALQLAARYDFGKPKLFAGYERIIYKNPSDPLSTNGIVDGLGVGQTIGGYNIVTNNAAFPRDKILDIFWAGARYTFTPKFEVALSYEGEKQHNYSTTAALSGCSNSVQSGQCSGSFDSVTAIAIYTFTKHLDAYGAVEWSRVSGGMANGYLRDTSIGPTAGVRISF